MFYNPSMVINAMKQINIYIETIDQKIAKLKKRIDNIVEEAELDIRHIVSQNCNDSGIEYEKKM